MAVSSYIAPNLIQGVSQQSPEQRRTTQCEEQVNCLNSIKEGAVARPGMDWKGTILGEDYTNAAFYEVVRGITEHYLVIVPHNATTGEVKVWDLQAQEFCTVTVDGSEEDYLKVYGGALAKDAFEFQTLDDYTFVANKGLTVAFTSTVQPARPYEALIFFRAGAYSHKYGIVVTINDLVYVWTYLTPDDSVAANGPYITTNAIASTFYVAMGGTQAQYSSGDAAPSEYDGVGLLFAGGTTGTGVINAVTDITTLGFKIDIRGNCIRIWQEPTDPDDAVDFKIDCADGVGNTFMSVVKDKARSLNDLPARGFVGFRLKVAGVDNEGADDYYVEYTDQDIWQECAGGGVNTTLDPATMPHALINTGPQTFDWVAIDWSTRLAGDNDSAPAPYVVGKKIQDVFHHSSRLGLLTEGAYDLSKTKNPFSFFPDTVQTVLGTAPISNPCQGATAIALMRKAVRVDESLFLWGQEAQFRVAADNQPFRQDTAETRFTTAFAFAEKADPVALGAGLYFVTEADQHAALKLVSFVAGKAGEPLDVSAHVPTYIDEGVRQIIANETLGMVFLRTDGHPQGLFQYSFKAQGAEIVQSAWQKWVVPEATVLWASISAGVLFVALQRADGVVFATCPLTTTTKDPATTSPG
jgi:hypothetical protein